ncbi:MAG: iron ABC transporter permease, partial [Bdellovibrionota bacterium]|nr:iron ABC transporter permease [Bdellovibrionota bacterium]
VEGMVSFATLGYAIPGPVLALGVLIPLAKFDNLIDSIALSLFGNGTGLIFSGSVAAILLAYLIRFFVLSYGSIQTGFLRITPKMDEAAIQLGAGVFDRVSKIHGPLLKRSLATSLILVFVDSMKELPATLMLRPFNYNTLATRLYELSSDERLMESAPWGVAIVLSGLLPLIILGHPVGGKRNNLKEEEKES